MTKIHIYKGFERFWHWAQALLILFLAVTGFEVHGSFRFFGYQNAVVYHSMAAWGFFALIIFAIFWHYATGEWRQYLPTTQNLNAQIRFYLIGMFRNEPHPVKKNVLSKLNPLQKLVYLGLKLLVIPGMVGSGLLYMYYRYPQAGKIKVLQIEGLQNIAFLHTAGAFLLIIFLVAHLYLITTGQTLWSNLKAMITGYEEVEASETTSTSVEQ